MKRIFLLLVSVLIFQSSDIFASGENVPAGARSAGMGNASVTHGDIWSAFNNQAGLSEVSSISAGVFYENRFFMPALGLKGGGIVLPSKYGVFSASGFSFGYKVYSETNAGIAYARSFSENFSAGMKFSYMKVQMGDVYGSKGLIIAEAGVRARLSKNMMMGMHIYNPARSKLASYNDERIAAIMRLGIDYRFSKKVLVCTEAEKDIEMKPVFKAGVEYLPAEALYVRAGVSTNPGTTSFGIGLNLKHLKIDIATGYHSVLGYSPQVALSYSVK
ncbi:MAG: hypothetical protein HYY40_06585 [Bacteroidetes bacterium]|nr:hypothetical protein [Bacteroidota bacterium]